MAAKKTSRKPSTSDTDIPDEVQRYKDLDDAKARFDGQRAEIEKPFKDKGKKLKAAQADAVKSVAGKIKKVDAELAELQEQIIGDGIMEEGDAHSFGGRTLKCEGGRTVDIDWEKFFRHAKQNMSPKRIAECVKGLNIDVIRVLMGDEARKVTIEKRNPVKLRFYGKR